MRKRIIVLGGYGNFGGRICRTLASEPDVSLLVAGWNLAAASDFVRGLGRTAADCEPIAIDHTDDKFPERLRALAPRLVVHTAGPFQGQNYHVAQAAIDTGAHYIDLADGRAFVTGISVLDSSAREKGVVVVSGASSLPALSGAVIDHLQPAFARMDSIAISIAPGQAIPRGLATTEAILSYCGRPFREWSDGHWIDVHGWQGLRRIRYPDLGIRWAARCDVPDLELLPEAYPMLKSVRFDAALELGASQIGMWTLAWLVRAGLVPNPKWFARIVLRGARFLDRFGADVGGMQVRIDGVLQTGAVGHREWNLTAQSGHGPEIPCIPAVVIARKLTRGEAIAPGARACRGMMALAEFNDAVRDLDISCQTSEQGAS